ncbi:hypothetical protein M3Y97_01029500 [Aphelenchoides bicaudatus]|nr:hypothetical protein M3Y97_01029500 [Aphelenchoides bicaudatus]
MCVYINAQASFDCSAKTLEGISHVFHDVPNCFERFKRLQAWQRTMNAQPRALNIGTQGSGQLFLAAINVGFHQSYQNVRDCWMNPGAFIDKKKTLTTYIPPLRRYLPYEKDGMPADRRTKFPGGKGGMPTCHKIKTPLVKSMSEAIEQKIPLVSSISEAFDQFSIKELLAKKKTNNDIDQPGPSCKVPLEPKSPLSILASAIDDFYLTQIMNIRNEHLNAEENEKLTVTEFFYNESSAPITKSISKTIERFKKKRLFAKRNSTEELLKSSSKEDVETESSL